MIFCEYCEILKNSFFYRTPPAAASKKIYFGSRKKHHQPNLKTLSDFSETFSPMKSPKRDLCFAESGYMPQ